MENLFGTLADLLEYPGEAWNARVEWCKQWVIAQEPTIAVPLIEFRRKVRTLSIEKLQELYTQTFDLNPVCTLDIGYHLFGENYKRGELLARLRETEASYEVGQANQLPDHLPVLLRLLVKLDDDELRAALIAELMIPALEKMIQALGETDNPYLDLIKVVSNVLTNEVPNAAALHSRADSTYVPELYQISLGTAAKV